MHDFRTIKRRCKNVIKEQSIFFYIPFMVHFLLIPALVWMSYQKYGLEDETRMQIIKFSQYFTPVLVILWILFALVKYIDYDGNEIFFLQKKIKIKEVIVLYLCYIVLNTLPFCVYGRMFSGMIWEWLRIVIETFLFAGLAYGLAFAIKNIAITMVAVVIYGFASVFMIGEHELIYFYYGQTDMTLQLLKEKYMWLLLAVVIFWLIGVICNHKMQNYH